MFDQVEAATLADNELSRLERAGRDFLLSMPSWKWQRREETAASGNVYWVESRAGLDNSDPESLVLVAVRVREPKSWRRARRVRRDLKMDSNGKVIGRRD